VINKCHPVANWLSIDPSLYRQSLQRVITDRDEQYKADPSASGLPPASRQWFWFEQLPRLVSDPKIRDQVLERQAALAASRIAIEEQIRLQAGVLIAEQAAIDTEMALLEQVLQ